jgi:hypothetical protein
MSMINKEQLYNLLMEEGLGQEPGDREKYRNNLINRGLTLEEACVFYEAECLFSKEFGMESFLTYAPNMKITYGTVMR